MYIIMFCHVAGSLGINWHNTKPWYVLAHSSWVRCTHAHTPYAANDNRYEGSWKNDMKNGAGKFFYLDKGQVYTGTWVDDVAKCGSLEDFGREGAPDPPVYPIPEVRTDTMRVSQPPSQF